MFRPSLRRRPHLAALALAFLLVVLPGAALAGGWADDEAADSTSDDIQDHEDGSQDPDAMTEGSRDPDQMTTDSQSMGSHMAGSEDPDADVTGAAKMDDTAGEGLMNLKMDKPDEGYVALEAPGQSEWQPTTNARVLMARKNILQAEARARAARTAYGDMMESDYPRGEARIRIVNERDAAFKAFEQAKQALAEADAAAAAAAR
jgi:hypothetical protein